MKTHILSKKNEYKNDISKMACLRMANLSSYQCRIDLINCSLYPSLSPILQSLAYIPFSEQNRFCHAPYKEVCIQHDKLDAPLMAGAAYREAHNQLPPYDWNQKALRRIWMIFLLYKSRRVKINIRYSTFHIIYEAGLMNLKILN